MTHVCRYHKQTHVLPSAVHGGGDLSRYSNKERKFHSRKMNLHYARKFSMSETLRHHAWAFSHSSTLRLLTQTLPPTNPVVNKLHEFIKMNIVLRVFAPVFLHELLELFVCFANESSLNSPFFFWYGGSIAPSRARSIAPSSSTQSVIASPRYDFASLGNSDTGRSTPLAALMATFATKQFRAIFCVQ